MHWYLAILQSYLGAHSDVCISASEYIQVVFVEINNVQVLAQVTMDDTQAIKMAK